MIVGPCGDVYYRSKDPVDKEVKWYYVQWNGEETGSITKVYVDWE